jgi:serine/threonine-protein kinase RsbW
VANKAIIPSDLTAARDLEETILQEIDATDLPSEDLFAIKLSLEEALTNAIRHGNHFDPEKSVIVEWEVSDRRVEIRITDEGCGFDPGCVPDPTADENIEKPCGRGIMLIHAYMDEVSYDQQGRQLRIVKHLGQEAGPA